MESGVLQKQPQVKLEVHGFLEFNPCEKKGKKGGGAKEDLNCSASPAKPQPTWATLEKLVPIRVSTSDCTCQIFALCFTQLLEKGGNFEGTQAHPENQGP